MIDDTVLQGRIPRIGTITTGRGVEASSQSGKSYSRPSRSDTLVFHCDDEEVANAVKRRYGGTVVSASLSWAFDVVTDATRAQVSLLPAGFRQSLELWSAASCLRRCDGVTMSTLNGQPSSDPCICDASGQERDCKPHTTLPVLIELDVQRFGVWEVKSTGWQTAANLKGTMQALGLTGRSVTAVPAIIEMKPRLVKDAQGKTHNIHELLAHIAVSNEAMASLPDAMPPQIAELPAVISEWEELRVQADAAGALESLRDGYAEMFGDVRIDELSESDMTIWVDYVRSYLQSTEK